MLTDVSLPTWATTSCQIIAFILTISLVLGVLVLSVWAVMATIAEIQAKREFKKTLNEHDKALIQTYEDIKPNPWKRRNK